MAGSAVTVTAAATTISSISAKAFYRICWWSFRVFGLTPLAPFPPFGMRNPSRTGAFLAVECPWSERHIDGHYGYHHRLKPRLRTPVQPSWRMIEWLRRSVGKIEALGMVRKKTRLNDVGLVRHWSHVRFHQKERYCVESAERGKKRSLANDRLINRYVTAIAEYERHAALRWRRIKPRRTLPAGSSGGVAAFGGMAKWRRHPSPSPRKQ